MPYKDPKDPRALESKRKHYRKNRKKYIEAKNKRKKEAQRLIIKYKSKPCADCGQKYPYYVMDFDHKFDKKFNLSTAPNRGFSIKKILEEVAKCDIVCSNCHRIRTFRDNS